MRRTFIIILLPVVMGCIFAKNIHAQPYTEYELKAAYLFNFGKFVIWPDEAFKTTGSVFYIGIYGKDPFGNVLNEVVKNKSLQNREVKILICENAADARKCHILFLSQVSGQQAMELVKELAGLPILTVGDQIDDFCQNGGVINFTPQNYKYRFEISNIAAQKLKLVISSKLLALAKIITEDEIKF